MGCQPQFENTSLGHSIEERWACERTQGQTEALLFLEFRLQGGKEVQQKLER